MSRIHYKLMISKPFKRSNEIQIFKRNTTCGQTANAQLDRAVGKPVNAKPGFKVYRSINFSYIKMFFFFKLLTFCVVLA